MSFLDPELLFDKAKPFYPLVVNYVIQVHGYLDISSRGILSRLQSLGPGVEGLLAYPGFKEKGFDQAVQAISKSGERGLIGQPELESKILGSGIKVDISLLADEVLDTHADSIIYFNRMTAGSLLILAWELTTRFHSDDPLWKFLRHCRNAAAHNGQFDLRGGEPKRPAKWRTLEIVGSLHGTPLFVDPPVRGFIGIGDTLLLLWDIEQTLLSVE